MGEILRPDQLRGYRRRHHCQRIVATNGCFDLLHVGHLRCLESARGRGDVLVVGVNGDASVAALKGLRRPVNPEADRAELLAALWCVDAVCVFPEVRAAEFLRQLRPDVYVKGGDYTLDTLNPLERFVIDKIGAEVYFFPQVDGKSTTALLDRLQ